MPPPLNVNTTCQTMNIWDIYFRMKRKVRAAVVVQGREVTQVQFRQMGRPPPKFATELRWKQWIFVTCILEWSVKLVLAAVAGHGRAVIQVRVHQVGRQAAGHRVTAIAEVLIVITCTEGWENLANQGNLELHKPRVKVCADSDHLYRGVGKPGKPRAPQAKGKGMCW